MKTIILWPSDFSGGDAVIDGEGSTWLSFTDHAEGATVRVHFNAESGAEFLRWLDDARAVIAGRGPRN